MTDFEIMVGRVEARGYIVNSYSPGDGRRRYYLAKPYGNGEKNLSGYLLSSEFLAFMEGFEAAFKEVST